MPQFTLEYPEFIKVKDILIEMETDPWVGHSHTPGDVPSDLNQQLQKMLTKRKNERKPCTIIREDGKIIGIGLSVPCTGYRARPAGLPEDNEYWKIGSLYVTPEYRGRGIATQALKWFVEQKKLVAYYVNRDNESSRLVAIRAGLTHTHDFATHISGRPVQIIQIGSNLRGTGFGYWECYMSVPFTNDVSQ